MPILYNITCIATNGLRTLIGPAQGRCMKKTRKEAEDELFEMLTSNSIGRLIEIYGKQAITTFRVDEFDCYEGHHDPKHIYIDDAPPITQLEFKGDDFEIAERIAKRLGFTQTAYTSSSALYGLFCLPDRPTQRKGTVIKTKEFGFMFVQDLEDMLIDPETVGAKKD